MSIPCPAKMRASTKLVLAVLLFFALILAATIGTFTWRARVNNRSLPGRIVRWWKGEIYVHQKANELVEEIHSNPEMAQLQPWAVETLARIQAGQVKLDKGTDLYWANDADFLAPEEMPEFIRKQWLRTNKFGEAWPKIEVVYLTNHLPDYIVLKWLGYGIAVGPPEYRLSFDPAGSKEVAPGIYTFYLTK